MGVALYSHISPKKKKEKMSDLFAMFILPACTMALL
jgi:hypothetical protein